MTIKVKFKNGTAKQFNALRKAVKTGGNNGLADIVKKGKNAVLESMRSPKSGIIYARKGRTHQASAPGETPAIDTGDLSKGIYTESFRRKQRARLGSSDKKSFGLEFGTLRVLARPFMTPTAQFMRTFLKDSVERGIINALNKEIP